ncbi:DUF3237 family protein [Geodermatophilus sp. SYSU D00697]
MDGYVLAARLPSTIPIGLVPEGLRLDVGVEGTITEGPMTGGRVTGVDHLLIRRDGTAVLDVHETITLPGGGIVSLQVRGFATPPFEMPPLETLAAPGFEWPDVEVPIHGAVTMQTAEPSLAALNHTVYGMTGTVNMARGEVRASARSIAAVPVS